MDKMKKKTLLTFIIAPILIVAGVLMNVLSDNNRVAAFGGVLICLGAMVLIFGVALVASVHSANKEKKEKEAKVLEEQMRLKKLLADGMAAVQNKTDYPETNTLKLVKEGVEFYAAGKYVCEKDFKNVAGYHFAFEISSTDLKTKPASYDDVCDIEGTGVTVEVGYFDGEALEEYANSNGVILQSPLENSVGQTIVLKENSGYAASVWTVDGDDIDYGFVKILGCENGVVTVYFKVNVPCGLCDTVEGVVKLKKDTEEENDITDIQSAIDFIKRKKFNTLSVSEDELQTIMQSNPFLPESYIAFLKEVGFADLDWIDVGMDNETATNLNEGETGYINDILKGYPSYSLDDYYFIGIDSGGTYYALSRNADDKKVYIFSDDASGIDTYESFEKFIIEILKCGDK